MSIVKPWTFVAGNKARANEVNDNFDVLYQQVNTNITNIANVEGDIQTLSSTKANVNGDSTQRFAVADPVSSGDAVNKRTLFKQIGNSIDYIGGLTISKDSSSQNNTILVDPGAAYDSTKAVVLALDVLTTKQNTTQSASATYYVYIIGSDTGSSIDILISTEPSVPTLPTGYTRYRKIGSYTTNSSNQIDLIISGESNKYDGIPVNHYDTLSSTKSSGTHTLDLYYHLPKDGSTYMVYLVLGIVDNGTNTVNQTVVSDIWSSMPAVNTAGGYADRSRSWFAIPVKRYLYYTLSRQVASNGSANLWIVGYRRIGTNS